ncbi:MAG TPA: nickel-dependent lactate racemase [Pyrinomonadaceae bacterium]|jgi:nickel-dependent lactate racemase|nr:nickel-dependent lactate racemase [Pyrinomonadaceae bacterium]
MNIELGYGRASLSLSVDEARYRLLVPEAGDTDERPLSDAQIGSAFDEPIASPPLEDILSPDESVLIVVSDATRATASAQITHLLVRRLIAMGVTPRDIRIIFATGIHRAVTREEKRELLTPFIVQRLKTLNHAADDESQLMSFGTTERGTPIELNRALKEHDHVILTGAINFHYFVGFTGGRKSVCPGLASVRTIEATHMLALDFEKGGRRAGVGAGLLDGNIVHEECERIAAEVAPSFLVNTVTNERGQAVRVYTGDWRVAHATACEDFKRDHTVKIDEKRPLMIASCGGFPHDINLIQAHKTLDMAAQACTQGGTIILVAECADGLGRADFLKWFEEENSRALEARLRERYEVNGQTAWALLTKAEQFRVFLVSALDDADVRRMRMMPARTIQDALAQVDSNVDGYVMPRGGALLPVMA